MTDVDERAQDERIRVFNSYRDLFASAPIRLMSRTVSAMRAMGYDDLASAIGDLDWRTVPVDDPEDPTLRDQWGHLLQSAFDHMSGWMDQLSSQPLGYNLDSIGYPAVTHAWSGLWSRTARHPVRERTASTASGVRAARRQPGRPGGAAGDRRGPP